MINFYPWCKLLFSASKHCFIFLTSLLLAADLLAQPIIHSFSPASGPVGTTVTIQGTNFSAGTSGNIVYFGAARATVLSATASNITVTVPSGATYQPITVTTNRLTSYSNQPFAVTAPAFHDFSLSSFASRENFFSGNYPNFIASGDLDGDGKSDLVSLNLNGNTISLFRNTGGAGTLSLAPAVYYDAGRHPFGAALGDLNGDGKLDVVIGDYSNSQIIVYKNAGTPGTIVLADKKEFASGLNPISVGIIDFDGDGKPDVAVVNNNSHTVSVFKNTSTPDSIRFAIKTDFPVGNWPQRLTIGDFDGDGKPDIAVPNYNDNTVSVLRNTSSAGIISFAQKLDWATGNEPFHASSADLTGDGLPELVVANSSAGTFSIYKNTSNAGVIAFADKVDVATGPSALYSALHDLDGDGKVDIVALGGSGLSVFKNYSRMDSIGFVPKFDYATGNLPRTLSIGDLTGDGQPDIAFVNSMDSTLSVLKNTMRPVPIIQSFNPVSATTDSVITITGKGFDNTTVVNIGGIPAVSYVATSTSISAKIGAGATGDVVVTTPHGTAVLPGFTFLAPAPVIKSFIPESGAIGTTVTVKGKNFRYISANPVVYFGAVKASISNATDTSLTVVVPSGATYAPITLTVNSLTAYSAKPFQVTFPGTGTGFKAGSFAVPKEVAAGGNPRSIAVADFDGDGNADLFVTNQSSATASVFRNTSTTKNISLAAKQDLPMEVDPFGVAAGDFDGDGKTDLAISNANSGNPGSVSIRRNTSTNGSISFSENSTMAVGDGPFGLAAADLNADGKPDLVVTAGNSGIIAVFKNTSDSVGHISFAPQLDIRALNHSDNIAIADLDGDSKPELITADFSRGSMSVWRNTSSGGVVSFAAPISYTAGTNSVGISAGDFDNDGKIDIAVVNYSSHTVSVFKNNSTPGNISFLEKQDYPTGQFPRAISLGDLDGDGKTDIIVPCNEPSAVSVIRNTSTAGVLLFANRVEYLVGTQPPGVSIADLDGDGKPEMVVANNYSSISILHNRVDEPILSSFTPTSAKTDVTVTIRGESFTGATAVKFGGMPAISFTIDADSIITAVVGKGATGQVQITTPYGSDTLSGFTYIPPAPVIKFFSPASGTVGTSVRIVGEHFGNTTSLRFGGMPAISFTIDADSIITAVVGKGATGQVQITTPYGSDTLSGFTYIPPAPVIKFFSPASGTVGTSVRIVGEHFGNTTSLRFGGMPAISFTIDADSIITAVVGKGATGDIIVFSKDGNDTLGKFTFIPPVPVVTSFTPTAGTAGTPVTIKGKNFSWTTGVSFGATKAALYNVTTDSTITAVLGDGGTGVIRITSEFGTDSLGTFVFLQPGALMVYPNPAVGSALLAHPATDGPSQLKLVDMNGRVVKTIDVPRQQAQTRIDLTNVKPGIYRVVWSDGQTSASQTILVQ